MTEDQERWMVQEEGICGAHGHRLVPWEDQWVCEDLVEYMDLREEDFADREEDFEETLSRCMECY